MCWSGGGGRRSRAQGSEWLWEVVSAVICGLDVPGSSHHTPIPRGAACPGLTTSTATGPLGVCLQSPPPKAESGFALQFQGPAPGNASQDWLKPQEWASYACPEEVISVFRQDQSDFTINSSTIQKL